MSGRRGRHSRSPLELLPEGLRRRDRSISLLELEPPQEGRQRRSPLELPVAEGLRRGRRSFQPEELQVRLTRWGGVGLMMISLY